MTSLFAARPPGAPSYRIPPTKEYSTAYIVVMMYSEDGGRHRLRTHSWRFVMKDADRRGRHYRPKISDWYTGLVIWNQAIELWDRVKIRMNNDGFDVARQVMSYPIDEDDETEWRSHEH
jgi:hypothetical protein